jgi:hypothetical protein
MRLRRLTYGKHYGVTARLRLTEARTKQSIALLWIRETFSEEWITQKQNREQTSGETKVKWIWGEKIGQGLIRKSGKKEIQEERVEDKNRIPLILLLNACSRNRGSNPDKISLFPTSRLALGPTQHPIQWLVLFPTEYTRSGRTADQPPAQNDYNMGT